MFHRIVVPTDFSECADEAWRLAKQMTAEGGGELVLTHVLTEVPRYGEGLFVIDLQRLEAEARAWAQGTLDDRVAKARAEGRAARSALRAGVPHHEIVALARDEHADLIVIGTHGRGGMSRLLLGSVADRVVRLAPCPVLTVRASA